MLNLTKGSLLAALCALSACAPAALAQSAVKFSEIQASNLSYVAPDGSLTDWVELVNTSGAPVDLTDMYLTDDDQVPKWIFPPGVSIPSNGYLFVACDSDRPPSVEASTNLNTGFSITADGGTLFLFDTSFVEVLDSVTFGNQVADLTIGRINGTWKLCTPTPNAPNVATNLGSNLALKINEWMANPASGDDWFEIYNPGALPVSLEGLFLTDTPTDKNTFYPVAPLTFIGSGLQAYAKFVADGSTNKGPEHMPFSLKAAGEAIGLFDGTGKSIDTVTFLAQVQGVSQGRLLDGSSTITSFPGTASPARSNYKDIPNIIVNELLAHTDPPLEDAVEFYNRSDSPINIGGWYLSNKESEPKKYRVPDNTMIPGKGYKVIYEGAFNNTNTAASPFTFNSAHGDQVYLSEAVNGTLTGFRVTQEFEASENGLSMGRVETSVPGDYKFVQLSARTFGKDNPATVEEFRTGIGLPNAAPLIGPVVINEVHFNPLSLDGSDNVEDEFIELYNITSSPVPLYDPLNPQNHWRLQNGVTFVFPGGRSVPANGYVLVVSFDPDADPIGTGHFRTRMHIPSNVPIFGPFGGNLNNDGDSLELYKPDAPQLPPHPDAGFVPYVRVDKVNYTDQAPWPSTADGTGFSLQRRNPLAFGNEPLNWDGATPTPGQSNSAELRDGDGDGMTDTWEDSNGFDKNNPADATLDADNDGMNNRDEFFAGTDPRSAASKLAIKSVTPPVADLAGLKITFSAAANKSYTVQYRDNFNISSDWQKLVDVPSQPFDHDETVEDTEAILKTDRYYRIITK